MTAVNKLLVERDEIIANFETVKQVLFDTVDLDVKHADFQREMAVVSEMIQKCVDENSHVAQSQEEYRQCYEGLVCRFEKAKSRFADVIELRTETKARRDRIEAFIANLRKQDGMISEFDEQLWSSLLDYVTVYSEDDMRFVFKNGTVIQT